jgi:RNA polymerase sigma-70 factor, ECF subfamily
MCIHKIGQSCCLSQSIHDSWKSCMELKTFANNPFGHNEEKESIDAFLSMRSETAFAAIAPALFARLVRYFRVFGLVTGTAEELAQDVLMIIYRKSGVLRSRDSFYGWLFKIARNEYLQYVRRCKRAVPLVDLECLSSTSVQPNIRSTAERTEFCDLIASLETREQQIMVLRYVEELSYREIATALALPVGTVKWKLFRARSKLLTVLNHSRNTQYESPLLVAEMSELCRKKPYAEATK